jgi:hypothetical protein
MSGTDDVLEKMSSSEEFSSCSIREGVQSDGEAEATIFIDGKGKVRQKKHSEHSGKGSRVSFEVLAPEPDPFPLPEDANSLNQEPRPKGSRNATEPGEAETPPVLSPEEVSSCRTWVPPCFGEGIAPLRMLDLFSGTGSIACNFSVRGYETTRVDNNANFSPDIHIDILRWEYWHQPVGYYTVIAASPPCTEYSTAMTCRERRLEEADALVKRALDIINYFQPDFWFMENPQRGLLKGRPVVKGLSYVDVDYCQFCTWG